MLNSVRCPARRSSQQLGFTLVELLVVVTVCAVLTAIAAPSFREQIANFRVRNAAEGVVTGLNLARAEAARRNKTVTFTLNSGGAGWSVTQVSPSSDIQARGNGDSTSLSVATTGGSSSISFLPTGIVDPATSPRLQQITLSSSVAGTNQRQIDVLGGGLIRVCDPTVTTANDPRNCS